MRYMLLIGMLLSLAITSQVKAEAILDVIDIRPIIDRHDDIGNAHGLAYSPSSGEIFLAHGSHSGGAFIYALDLEGNVLRELDFAEAFLAGAYVVSMSYSMSKGRLIALAAVSVGQGSEFHHIEMDPTSLDVLSSMVVPVESGSGSSGISVEDGGIWQSRFAEDTIRRYTSDWVYIEDASVAASFPGFPGPGDLSPSPFSAGLLVTDHFGRRIVEVNRNGEEFNAFSTEALGDGRGISIASDLFNDRVFLQVNNEDIFVLGADFFRPPQLPLSDDSDVAGGDRADDARGAYDTIYVRSPYRLGLLRFTGTPVDGEMISRADLRLYLDVLRLTENAQSGMIYVRPILTDWDENTVTWRTRPAVGDFVVSQAVTAADVGRFVSTDITDIARLWSDGSIHPAGLQIESSAEIAAAIFHSQENPSGLSAELTILTGLPTSLEFSIAVLDLQSSLPIENGSTISPGRQVQVSVRTNSVDCAGQFIVTALSESNDAPVIVQAVPFIIGPSEGSDVAIGDPVNAETTGAGTNAFKISATCNGVPTARFAEAFFEFNVM